MDELARFSKARWEALAAAQVQYSRPMLDLTAETARALIDDHGLIGDLNGKRVLCLAGGGGQQSAAFALLGAQVTVVDLSDTQLERDREALAHYGLRAALISGDMRDLSALDAQSFDVVCNPHSINFVPDAGVVFDQVRRVIRPGGFYRLCWFNPFAWGFDLADWNGQGYILGRPYRNGEGVLGAPQYWEFTDLDGVRQKIEGPRDFNHTLSTVINGLIGRGFSIMGLWELGALDLNAVPGSWEHLQSVMPQSLVLVTRG